MIDLAFDVDEAGDDRLGVRVRFDAEALGDRLQAAAGQRAKLVGGVLPKISATSAASPSMRNTYAYQVFNNKLMRTFICASAPFGLRVARRVRA